MQYGIFKGANGVILNGNYVPADPAKYALGETYGSNGDEFTGTKEAYIAVSPNDVREGVQTGLVSSPVPGNVHLPVDTVVLLGYGYGSNRLELTGNYRPTAQEELFVEGGLVIGDDYLDANGRPLTFFVAAPFTPVSSELKYWNDGYSYTSTDFSITGTSPSFEVRHFINGVDTSAALVEGWYRWALTLKDAGNKVATVAFGSCDYGRARWFASEKAA